MQTLITWKSLYYHSQEHCELVESTNGNVIASHIKGDFEAKKYWVDYTIHTNKNWETINAKIAVKINDDTLGWQLKKQYRKWLLNDKPLKHFDNAIDVDISLTPFTNTLPIQRLHLQQGESRVIEVMYFDILNKAIKLVKQIYTRISAHEYKYENSDKDFQALLQVNTQGLVESYPGLFERANE